MKVHSISKLFIISILLILFTGNMFAQSASISINVDAKINQLLELKKQLEKDNKLSDGYTIQLYYGELEDANITLKRYRSNYSSWPASIEYETPNYKVWVGNFSSGLEADRALIEVQHSFVSAFILKRK